MEKEIETLRGELNKLVEESSCLYSDGVIKLSQELDNLIHKYYLSAESA
ncbi:aspartyl-phosphate phosphatase Spo0E family protein [Clostridium thailandense]|uniref:Aspartyl-phosphate phosphatase Spo0E family protein n=1 Tax=Clostridium thailandense TaxID=2794346 RepID=A0A949WPV6_9CLOT|nr:aspartyl-phosphate phosphatase Spo0E family protein [Clostridium thailandense]MBV7271850.1 aspartyl-phosphate phosphatase Spo0E family protein [Clostridium thailandense]MCH5136863.1 aspartyl-phosphate phosphatase Spo0E family protein [Clostridiaceae bacterium UIB06]